MLGFVISKRKLLFRYVTFPFMLVLLMGMVNPDGDEQEYHQVYDEIVGNYNELNNGEAAEIFDALMDSVVHNVNTIHASIDDYIAWAASNVALTRSNFSRAHLLYYRIQAIHAAFQTYTQHIRVRNIPGRVNLNDNEQLLMAAASRCERIERNARDVYTSACRALRTAAHVSPDGLDLPNGMRRYDVQEGVVPIQNEEHPINENMIQLQNLVPNIGLGDVQGVQNIIELHNDSLRRVQLISNSANFIARYPRNSFNDVLVLGELMRDIRQAVNEIQHLIPENAAFELPIDNINYPVLPAELFNRIIWNQ